ncbi:MAG: peptidase, partial [Bradymonadaceae bacterium]
MNRLMILLVIFSMGCSDWMLGEDPVNGPEENFEIFWKSFDRHYAHFEIKDVDWRGLYEVHRPQVGPQTTEEELFEVMASLIGY